MIVRLLPMLLLALCYSSGVMAGDWSQEQIPKLPTGETAVQLFNGKDLDGWVGYIGKYYAVEDGMIVGRNSAENAPKSSTYLMTQKSFRNFRLILESRLVTSEMHSGISLWGKAIEKDEGPFTYQGHLVMYPQPELCESGPIGLQLHSNKVAQEVQWRGLVLTENPVDQLVTAESYDAGLLVAGKPAESGVDEAALKQIDTRMQEFVAAKQISGAVTLVARRGRVVHLGAVGKADVASGRDVAVDTVFAIASMTKPITAASVMILQDEGQLKLDDPISKYIPAFKDTKVTGGKIPSREITIRDCLMHTNGLVSDQRNVGTLANTVELLAKSELAFEPGSKWQYGPGLSVAGRVVEIVSGKPFDQFLAERIFAPLEMNQTSFHPTAEQLQRLALLYQPTADKKDIERGNHWLYEVNAETSPNPSGGLYSTASDLVRFYQMILHGGDLNGKRILSHDAVQQMTSLQSGELETGFTPGNGWGLGFCLVRKPQGVTDMLAPGAFGHGGAFGTQGWIDPQQEMIFVLLIARQNFAGGDASDLRADFQRLAVGAIRD